MTEAEIKTALDNLDTEEAALLSAQDVEIQAGDGGGRVKISGLSAKLDYIAKRRLYLKRRLFVAQGARPADPKVPGIDVDQLTDNDDGLC